MASSNPEIPSGTDAVIRDKTIIVAVSASIAAYKAADLVSRLRQAGAAVLVCMTPSAARFVAPLTMETLSGAPVYLDHLGEGAPIRHVELAKRADAVVHAPATADLIARLAAGRADDFPTAVSLSTRAPILVVPAMETEMWLHPATRSNLDRLREYGYRIMPPAEGRLASGASGLGRMQEPAEIFKYIKGLFAPRDLVGRKVLITAGPTRERFDPVRYWSNYSSGKMGFALAEAARDRGAEVCLISGPTHLPQPSGIKNIRIQTALEMYETCLQLAADFDLIIKAAAVADFRPANIHQEKVAKREGELRVEFVRNPDILRELGQCKRQGQVLVGFSAESHGGLERAERKLCEKNCDYMVWNDIAEQGTGFGSDFNRVKILSKTGGIVELPLLDKYQTAMAILDQVVAGMPSSRMGSVGTAMEPN